MKISFCRAVDTTCITSDFKLDGYTNQCTRIARPDEIDRNL